MLIHRTRVSSAICGSLNTWDRRRKRKSTATAARFESTRTVAATRPQPPIHPSQGPNARVAQVKVVPESGIAVLSSRYPKTTRSIGMKPMSSADGVRTPTSEIVGGRPEAGDEAGAGQEVRMTAQHEEQSCAAR